MNNMSSGAGAPGAKGAYMGTNGSAVLSLSANDTLALYVMSAVTCTVTTDSRSELSIARIGD